MNPLSLLSRLPVWLQRAIGYGLTAGLTLALVVLSVASVPVLRDWLRNGLDIPSKSELLSVQTDAVELSEDQIRSAIVYTVNARAAQDSARYSRLFDTLSNELIEPGIRRLQSVESQVQRLNELMGVSRTIQLEQLDVAKDVNSRMSLLQHQFNNSPVPDSQAEMLRMMRTMQLAIDSLRKQQPVRNSKVKL